MLRNSAADGETRAPMPDDLCLMLYPTLRCNVRCTFCYQESFATELDRRVFEHDLLPVYPHVRELQIVGGEITILPWMPGYIRWLVDRFPAIKLHVITNGIKLNAEWRSLVLEHSIDVVFSLNAPSSETYRTVVASPAAPGLWRRSFGNLMRLLDLVRAAGRTDIRIDISMVVTQDTAPFMDRFAALAKKLGVGCRLVFDCRADGTTFVDPALIARLGALRAWLAPGPLRIVGLGPAADSTDPQTAESARREWDALRDAPLPLDGICEDAGKETAAALNAVAGRPSSEGADSNFGAKVGSVDGRPACLAPWRSLVVTTWGDVLFCPNMAGTPLGNIHESAVHDIWNSPRAVEIRQSVARGDYRFCPTTCPTRSPGR